MNKNLKNGDIVVFTENPFFYHDGAVILEETEVVVQNLSGGYFKFAVPAMPNKPVFSASVDWVKRV